MREGKPPRLTLALRPRRNLTAVKARGPIRHIESWHIDRRETAKL
jgi:hypothetical protein